MFKAKKEDDKNQTHQDEQNPFLNSIADERLPEFDVTGTALNDL